MNIKRVPCLAVVTEGPNLNRVVEVVRFDAEATKYFGEPTWHCRSENTLFGFTGGRMLELKECACQDRGLRPIDDTSEPEAMSEEASC